MTDVAESKAALPEVTIRGSGSFILPGLGEGRFSGSGQISRGSIVSRGSCRLPGGIRTERIETTGSSHIRGDLEADTASFRGSAHVEGGLKFRDVESRGSLHVARDAEGGSLDSSGSTHVGGTLKLTGSLNAKGSLRADADIEADTAEVRGSLQTHGRLTAKRLYAALGGSTSRVDGGITADQIRVERGNMESWISEPELVTPSVTGDDVWIENVTCGSVTGRRVEVGRNCRIRGPVKYSESINVHPSAWLAEPPVKNENI